LIAGVRMACVALAWLLEHWQITGQVQLLS